LFKVFTIKQILFILALVSFWLSASVAFADEKAREPQWVMRKNKFGVIEIMDADAANFTDKKNKAPQPSQKSLDAVLKELHSMRIFDGGMSNGQLLSDKILFETSDEKALVELKGLLQIVQDPKSFGRDMCSGGPTLELVGTSGQKNLIAIHHGFTIRWLAWSSDARLLEPRKFIEWLAGKGVNGPKKEMERSIAQAKYDSEEGQLSRLHQFESTMPKSLRAFLGQLHLGKINDRQMSYELRDMSDTYKLIAKEDRIKEARKSLEKETPSQADQIKILLEWSGAIEDPFSAAYRGFPVEILNLYEPDAVTNIVKSDLSTSNQWIGAARFYSGMEFRDRFPDGYAPLDKTLMKRIADEVAATGKNKGDLDSLKDAEDDWMPPVRREMLHRK
jgi:hypothetical protein